jgi:hypothetical protein
MSEHSQEELTLVAAFFLMTEMTHNEKSNHSRWQKAI